MEKTPRRSDSVPPPSGSVVVDPRSQNPSAGSGPASSRGQRSASAGGARRKAEATLVLQARRVDSLRRQVVERQRAEQKGRRRQMALWGLAGAGAVLLGGWLATRLSPKGQDQDEAPLVLGRAEEESADAAPEAGLAEEQADAEAAGEVSERARRGASRRAGARTAGDAVAAAAPGTDAPAEEASSPQPQPALGERQPDEPKTVGDWGDGFEGSAREGSPRDGHAGARRDARPASTGSPAVDLDELPTE